MAENYRITPTKVHYLKMYKKPDIDTIEMQDSILKKLSSPITTTDYLHYFRTIGEIYNWHDRLIMGESELYNKINSPKTEIFIYFISQNPVGFAEFKRENEYTEILYFGLFPNYIGKGFGRHFLQKVINECWNNQPKWIQLNTCELDHSNALPTYKKSGFELDKTTIENRKVIIS